MGSDTKHSSTPPAASSPSGPAAEGSPLELQRHGSVLVITIDRPERRNALSMATLRAFGKIGQRPLQETDRAVVVIGRGEAAFCAGADLKERARMNDAEVREQLERYRSDLGWIASCSVPTVAAINGAALGGGLELSLMCDLRVAAEHATFALPETGLGVIPAAGGTQRLPRIVGAARAREMILRRRHLNAAEALAMGLVHEVVEGGEEFLPRVLAWLTPLVEAAPIATRAALQALRAAEQLSLEEGLRHELWSYEACLRSEDRREALRAFAERRKPVFHGR